MATHAHTTDPATVGTTPMPAGQADAEQARRRTMLAGIVAALAFPAVAGAAELPATCGGMSDAELIRAGVTCRRLSPQIAGVVAQSFAEPAGSPHLDLLGDQEIKLAGTVDDLVDMAIETPAMTAEGCRAKAILLQWVIERYESDGGVTHQLALSLCNDMVGVQA